MMNALRIIVCIVGTTFDNVVPMTDEGVVPMNGTSVPFTETLLRSILDLNPDQQLELVSSLAKGDMQSGLIFVMI